METAVLHTHSAPLAALKIMESNEIESTGSSDKGMSAKIDSISPMQEKGRL